MKCHYEILEVSREATDDEIKKSYRKLALKWHPDKNPDNIDEVTRTFHLIQQAYEVLIDPQERAWYDKHREAILRGGLGRGDDYKDSSLDVYQYFNSSCYSGFDDSEDGFYAVYCEVFEKIATEDYEYLDDKDWKAPGFGKSDSDYEEVVHPFYSYWSSYFTSKSYVWVEKYDTREGPNRQVRRLMEQDNKKLREKAKKERNEEVRALVAFVRKRDKRVIKHKKMLEERAEEVAKLSKERQAKDREERRKKMENYKEADWSASSQFENDLSGLEAAYAAQFGEEKPPGEEGEEDSAEEEEVIEELYCVACNKTFKTDKAFANHEKSKKHKERVAIVMAELEAEEEELLEEELNEDLNDLSLDDEELLRLEEENEKLLEEEIKLLEEEDLLESEDDAPVDDTASKQKLSKKQKKKRKQQQKAQTENNLEKEKDGVPEDGKPADESAKEISTGAKDVGDNINTDETSATDGAQDGCAPANRGAEGEGGQPSDSAPAPNVAKSKKKKPVQEPDPNQKEGFCNTCGRTFPSRSKLFEHLKSTGHALRIDQNQAPESAKPKQKGRKGKKR